MTDSRTAAARLSAWLTVALAAVGCQPSSLPRAAASQPVTSAGPRPDPEPWRSAIPGPGAPGELDFPVPTRIELPNGVVALVLRRPQPVVAITAVARCGASAAAPGQAGIAALANRMLLEGTTRRSSDELAVAAEDLGSTFDADAGRDYATVNLTVLPADVGRAFALISEVLREPAFTATDFSRVRSEWLSSLAAERQDPSRLASLIGLRVLAGPVLGAPVRGGAGEVERLTRDDVAAFYRSCYRPGDTAVVVVGDVDVAEAGRLAHEHFASFSAAAPPPPAPSAPPEGAELARLYLADRPGAVQSAVFVALPMPARGAVGHEARLVMNAALGGLFTSRLNQNLREAHAYTYGIGSSVIATRRWGGWVAATTVATEDTAAALRELRRELVELSGSPPRRPLSADELQRAKAALAHGHAAKLVDVRDIAYEMSTAFAQGLPAEYPALFGALVREVSLDAANRAAAEHLRADRLQIVVVGDRSRIEATLRTDWPEVETAHPTLLE